MSHQSESDPQISSSQNGDPHPIRNFLIGFTIGAIGSSILWVAGRDFFMQPGGGEFFGLYSYAIFLIPILGLCKVAFGVYLCFTRGWKAFGVGLLASVPVGAMILFGACTQWRM